MVIQDADMEYDPAEVPTLIEPIERGSADVVYGSRLAGGKPQRAYLFWHLIGNRFLSLVTGLLFNTTLSDMETGYKAFRVEVLRSLDLRENDFAIEPEITGQICKQKLGSTSCRSPTTAARTPRARRSPGATGSRRSGCSCAYVSPDRSVVSAHARRQDRRRRRARLRRRGADRRDAAGDPGLRRPHLRRRRRVDGRNRRARALCRRPARRGGRARAEPRRRRGDRHRLQARARPSGWTRSR